MTTDDDYLVKRFKALCNDVPLRTIAARTGLSEESLTQVLRGYKLPSGRPRGVGPRARKLLDAHYPGWSQEPLPPKRGDGQPEDPNMTFLSELAAQLTRAQQERLIAVAEMLVRHGDLVTVDVSLSLSARAVAPTRLPVKDR